MAGPVFRRPRTIAPVPTPIHIRLHAAAEALHAETAAEDIPLQHLADAHGRAAIGTLLALLAMPCVLPVPGVGTALGWGILALAVALWRGHQEVSLPGKVARMTLPRVLAQRVLRVLAKFYGLASVWSRERMGQWLEPRAARWLAPMLALMAVLIILPIPLGNVLPALSVVLLGLGLAFRDGLAVLLSLLAALLALAYALAFGFGLYWLGAEGMARFF
jgi:hypothetical protein